MGDKFIKKNEEKFKNKTNKVFFDVIERYHIILFSTFKLFRDNNDYSFTRIDLTEKCDFGELDNEPKDYTIKRDLAFLTESLVYDNKETINKGKRYWKSEYLDINFSKDNDKLSNLCKYLGTMLYTNPHYNITSSLIYGIIEPHLKHQTNQLIQNQFINDTITRQYLSFIQYHKQENSYPIQLLLHLCKLNSKINIKILDNDSEINLNKVHIEKILIDEDSFGLKLNKTVIYLEDLNQIELIESYKKLEDEKEDSIQLDKDIKKLRDILSEHPTEIVKTILNLIDEIKQINQAFSF